MAKGYRFIVGCDEAGRGPLVGPVVGAACHLPRHIEIEGLNDSKQLTEKKRLKVYEQLRSSREILIGVGIVSAREIDEINILRASLKAMKMAVEQIGQLIDLIFVDGNRGFDFPAKVVPVIGGDTLVRPIAAASVVAKVVRDEIMVEMGRRFPGYGLEKHKGYPTKEHFEALKELGPIREEYRMSFGPLKETVNG